MNFDSGFTKLWEFETEDSIKAQEISLNLGKAFLLNKIYKNISLMNLFDCISGYK